MKLSPKILYIATLSPILRNRHPPTLGGENETLRVKNHHKSIENTAKYRQREQVYYLQIRHQVFGKQLYMRLGSVLSVTDTRDISGAEICSQINSFNLQCARKRYKMYAETKSNYTSSRVTKVEPPYLIGKILIDHYE